MLVETARQMLRIVRNIFPVSKISAAKIRRLYFSLLPACNETDSFTERFAWCEVKAIIEIHNEF